MPNIGPVRNGKGSNTTFGFITEHPCEGCVNAERCRQGLACAALSLFVSTGRISGVASRQPNRKIYERLYGCNRQRDCRQ
jgi:hypothetical protein